MEKKHLDWALYVSLFLLVLITLVDLAMVGEHQQFQRWVTFDTEQEFQKKNFSNYINSMNGIMVLSVFFLLFLPFYVYSAYQTEKKCHLIFLAVYGVLFFFGLWVALIVFLTGYTDLRKSLRSEWTDGYAKNKELCQKDERSLIRCAYSWSFVNAQRAATAHIIFLSLFGLFFWFPLYKTNSERAENDNQEQAASGGATNSNKYADNDNNAKKDVEER